MIQEPWHEDDLFWQTTAPFMFGEARWENTPEEVDKLVALLAIKPEDHVLDCACGPGRHSLELARRGFQVTGIDRTLSYLSSARQRAIAEGLTADFLLEDIRHFSRPNAFAAAISMYTSFGYFDDPAENRQVLLNLYQSLKDGGVLLLELSGKEIIARDFQTRDWLERDGVFMLEERTVVADWTRMENRWIVVNQGEINEFRITHWLYSAGELKALLSECGFQRIAIYGDLAGAAYDQEAKRLVAVGYK